METVFPIPSLSVTFVHGGVLTSMGKTFRRNVRPFLLNSSDSSTPPTPTQQAAKRAYDLAGWFSVQVTLNYLASSFLLLDLSSCIKFFNRTWWYGDVVIALSWLFFKFATPDLKRALKKREALAPAPSPSPSSGEGLASSVSTSRAETPSSPSAQDPSTHPSIVVSPPPTSISSFKPPPLFTPPPPSLDLASTPTPPSADISSSSSANSSSASTSNPDWEWEDVGKGSPPMPAAQNFGVGEVTERALKDAGVDIAGDGSSGA